MDASARLVNLAVAMDIGMTVSVTLTKIPFSSGTLPERGHDAGSMLRSIPFSSGALPERGCNAEQEALEFIAGLKGTIQ